MLLNDFFINCGVFIFYINSILSRFITFCTGKSFIIPDSNDYGITAGDQAGEEQLLFVITSTNRPALANKIAARFAGSTTKAYGGRVTENWGVDDLKYPVGL